MQELYYLLASERDLAQINDTILALVINLIGYDGDHHNSGYGGAYNTAKETLDVLLPHLSRTQIELFIPKILEKLMDSEGRVRSPVLKFLRAFAPDELVTKIKGLIQENIAKLDDVDAVICSAALRTLKALVPHATTKTQKDILIPVVTKQLSAVNWTVRGAASCILAGLMPAGLNQIDLLLEAATTQPPEMEGWDSKTQREILETIAPSLGGGSILASTVSAIVQSLKMESMAVIIQLQTFAVLAPHTTTRQLNHFIQIPAVIEKLNHTNKIVCQAARKTLLALAPHATPAHINLMIQAAVGKLTDEQEATRMGTLNFLSSLMINNPHACTCLSEYNETHPASTAEHQMLNLMLETYGAIYIPECTLFDAPKIL